MQYRKYLQNILILDWYIHIFALCIGHRIASLKIAHFFCSSIPNVIVFFCSEFSASMLFLLVKWCPYNFFAFIGIYKHRTRSELVCWQCHCFVVVLFTFCYLFFQNRCTLSGISDILFPKLFFRVRLLWLFVTCICANRNLKR